MRTRRRSRKRPAFPAGVWVGRALAVLVAAGYLIAAVVLQDGSTKWLPVLGLALLIPLALIWFPQPIGSASGYMINRQYVDQPTPPVLISAAGWFFLVGLPLTYFLILR
jgi:hypothetical protein